MMEDSDIVIVEIPKPLVKSPKIIKKRGIATQFRVGRGYSISEIKEAGLTLKLAKQLNIPIDVRRRSTHKVNVDNLKKIVEQISILMSIRKTKPAKIVQQGEEEAKDKE